MVALPAHLDEALVATVADELDALALLVRARLSSWRGEPVALDDAPLTVRMLWSRVGYDERLTAAMLANPSRAHAERTIAAQHLDRALLPSTTRLVHVDESGLGVLMTDEDHDRDDPPISAWLGEEECLRPHAASYLRWAANVLVRVAWRSAYRSSVPAGPVEWAGAARPFAIVAPTTLAIAEHVWRIPPDPDEGAPGTQRIELAHEDFAGLVDALQRAEPRPHTVRPSLAGDVVELERSLAELLALQPELHRLGQQHAIGIIDGLGVVATGERDRVSLVTDAGAGARLRERLG